MSELSSELLHATTIVIDGRGVMIEGLPGVGKSDLALRLIDRGALLVSDDYTLVVRRDGSAIATPAPNIAGKIEVRGIGIVEMAHTEEAPIALVVSLGEAGQRLPEPGASRKVAGVDVPNIAMHGFEASAPIKVELALGRLA